MYPPPELCLLVTEDWLDGHQAYILTLIEWPDREIQSRLSTVDPASWFNDHGGSWDADGYALCAGMADEVQLRTAVSLRSRPSCDSEPYPLNSWVKPTLAATPNWEKGCFT